MRNSPRRLGFLLRLGAFGLIGLPATYAAASSPAAAALSGATVLSTFDQGELAVFERKASLAKRLGATHVPLTDGLPTARWQFVPADDPYPGWFIQRPDFLKLFPPAEVAPYVDQDYARRICTILGERARILRQLGLKAHWGSNLPQVMPEAFFTAYPHLRGPRVDQPNRSRVARFSMCVDQPETLRLYATAMKSLLALCPELESFSFLTQDSGSGFCWVPALYPGLNGHSDCRARPMSERISSFLITLQTAAREVGHEVQINLNPIEPRQWMIPSFGPEQLDAIAHRLPRGIAVQGREGPDGRPYRYLGSSDAYAHGSFYPVVGLAVPDLRWLRTGRTAPIKAEAGMPARRLISLRPDEATMAFSAQLYEATRATIDGSVAERLGALRNFAATVAGEVGADDLLQIWLLLDDAERRLEALNFGDMLQFGHVLNRWVNRPMVPFPAELSAEDKAYYRRFLFQAKGEEQADNLADIQAMRMYEGFGARLLFQRVIETVVPTVEDAQARAERLARGAPDAEARQRWKLLGKRLEVMVCLLHSADHMVAYQAQLDRVKALGVEPEPNPPLGAESSWDRTDLVRLAREEIDTTVRLKRLLESTSEPLLDLASVPEEETIMRLGPTLAAQLQRKIDLMNAHWMDYDRLFTKPNP
ncbi:hypothetical protein [Opitutus sp. ER46]|uniref:hypothetical protein n=1 Tax=Opitutus sp. ER46 TaxID=2161864 RepID=UPI000D2FFF0A|nr:hypothetical protein [Opitutus sp. ER46]PTX94286.1 hypothetical protein DB354_11015 [Opitutus sp. ER46]